MKRIVTTLLIALAAVGSGSVPAQAGIVDDVTCAVYDKIGVEHVRECGTGNPDS